ncbi:MAG: YfhO family protein [Candidatus Levybacteria bacterium]|nr:YfhO family protein [Candidatus Levybacteria bacterium]
MRKDILFVILIFITLTFLFFKPYFFEKKVPIPGNLLVSYYEPFSSYKWKGYVSGPPSKPIGFDNLRIFYPLRKITTDQIKNFTLPLWNPYYFSGNTLLATYQSAAFHPLSFLFLFLPQIDAWSIIIILTPLTTGVFMYLFLKELSLDKKASFFGATVFTFSGFMIAWWEESLMSTYSAVFLPIVLFAILNFRKKLSAFSFSILIAGLTLSILSGWFQTSLYVFLFSFLWLFYLFVKKEITFKKLVWILSGFLISLLIAGIHLIPSLEAYIYSARGTTDAKFIFDLYLLPLNRLVTFISSDFFGNPGVHNYFGGGFFYERVLYIGIPGLIFGLFALLTKTHKYSIFFRIVFLVTLSLGLSLPTSWFLLYYSKMPFLSAIIPSRIFLISTFSISVLSAFGLNYFLTQKISKKSFMLVILILTSVFIAAWGFVFYKRIIDPSGEFATRSFRNLILPSIFYLVSIIIILISAFFKKITNHVAYFMIIISLFGSLYFANKYLYFSDREFVFPNLPILEQAKRVAGVSRVWSVGKSYVESNLLTYYNLYSPEGYDSFYISRYGELLFAGTNKGKYSQEIPRADAKLPFAENMETIESDHYRNRLLSLLSVAYIIDRDLKPKEDNVGSNLNRIWSDGKFLLYRNKLALPRTFLVGKFEKKEKPQEILNTLFDPNIDLSKIVILEENPINFSSVEDFQGTSEINLYSPNLISVKTKTNNNSILFLSDNFYPGWNAYIDNQKTKIYRANYSFRAVVVPGGNHMVTFKYEPLSFKLGLASTLLGLMLFSFLAVVLHKIKK